MQTARSRDHRAGAHPEIAAKLDAAVGEFRDALLQDLNTAGALGTVFELVRALNAAIDAGELGAGDVPEVKAAFESFDKVLGVIALRQQEDRHPALPVEEIERLVAARQAARRKPRILPRAIASATSCLPRASSSRIRRRARAGSGSRAG